MPRFGTKSLLIVFAVTALWLSTFSSFSAAADVRRSILLVILIASGFAAVYNRGRRRAFWSAFFVVMLICGGLSVYRPLHRYTPDFLWLAYLQAPSGFAPTPIATLPTSPTYSAPYVAPPASSTGTIYYSPQITLTPSPYQFPGSTTSEALTETITTIWTFALAIVAGFAAAYLCSQFEITASKSP